MNIALIAHDEMKDTMIGFCIAYERILKNYGLYGTCLLYTSICN